MLLEDMAKKQAVARLLLLTRKLNQILAEKAMLEQFLASGEMQSFRKSTTLRKNSVAKWTIQGHIRRLLQSEGGAMKADTIFEALRQNDAGLKPATFRSHIKRLTDNGIIERAGDRGYYQLVRAAPSEEKHERN